MYVKDFEECYKGIFLYINIIYDVDVGRKFARRRVSRIVIVCTYTYVYICMRVYGGNVLILN